MRMALHAKVACSKRNLTRNNFTRNKVEIRSRKRRTLRKRLLSRQERIKGINDLGGRWLLYLQKERTAANGI
jgi:hypothetical protein